eukprot:SAG11_NODE_23029_length_396_cov_0.868687_1_plen_52_part_10
MRLRWIARTAKAQRGVRTDLAAPTTAVRWGAILTMAQLPRKPASTAAAAAAA